MECPVYVSNATFDVCFYDTVVYGPSIKLSTIFLELAVLSAIFFGIVMLIKLRD